VPHLDKARSEADWCGSYFNPTFLKETTIMKISTDKNITYQATLHANPRLIQAVFGCSPRELSESIDQAVEAPVPIQWSYSGDYLSNGHIASGYWRGEKAATDKIAPSHCPVPAEARLIGNRLLSHFGRIVVVRSEYIPIAGAIAGRGEFILEPEVILLDGLSPSLPRIDPSVFLKDCRGPCEAMIGFGIRNDGIWFPNIWFLTADNKIVHYRGTSRHFFGVRVNEQTAETFINLVIECGL
jgi:hypothetical protein